MKYSCVFDTLKIGSSFNGEENDWFFLKIASLQALKTTEVTASVTTTKRPNYGSNVYSSSNRSFLKAVKVKKVSKNFPSRDESWSGIQPCTFAI